MEDWYILSDIPYQKDFPPLIEVDWEPGTYYWSILTDIPYMSEFLPSYQVDDRPLNPDIWFINTDIPYHKEFVSMIPINAQPGTRGWYILDDIPYMHEFPEFVAVDARPISPDAWFINTDIPYKHEYPELIEIDDYPSTKIWYINTDIPYQPTYPALEAVDERPLNPDIWFINTDIPYKPQWALLTAIDDIPHNVWYIDTDIPYMPVYAELCPVDDQPRFWFILEDIPYMKTYPELIAIEHPPQLTWYILDDIPYMKQFVELCPIDDVPRMWYILDDIPYMRVYPELIPVRAVPHLNWYILEDIPYMREFPRLIAIDDKPHSWHILYDIPYMKPYPALIAINAIPKHYISKTYMVVGVGTIGRWQIRTCPDNDTENWTLIEDLGPPSAVLSACIEADGDFDYIAGNDSITLTTTDTPWMAVITTTKKLYVKQVCADITTAILLDTGVEQASLCRGWKSDKYSVDSGLICAYRKANGVYAKVYKKVNGEYVWETLPQLLYEPVDHVEVKRLNDYRIGVYVTNPNRLLLSERFYIGGTSKTEYISVKLKPWANVCSFSMVGEPAEQTFKVERCWMEEDTKVRMHCNYPIVSYDPTYPNLTLTDDYNYSKLVEYYIQNGDLVCILDKPKYSQFNTIRIVIPSINRILYQITPQFKKIVPGGQYAVENPPIAEYIDVQITATAGILSTTEKQEYHYNYDSEHISVTLTAQAGRITTTELTQQVYKYDVETILVSISTSAGVFTMTQEGDLPI